MSSKGKKGLSGRFKGVPRIGVGGIHCPCCNSYKGPHKGEPGRHARRKAKLELKAEQDD